MESDVLDETIKRAKKWLIFSGIQNLDSNFLDVKGGFNSWYDIDKENYFYTYSEISGYSIITLLFLNSFEKNNLYFLRAILSSEWLLDKASHKSGGVKTRYYLDRENAPESYDFSSGMIHSFDNGIALSGLMELYKSTLEYRYLKTAIRIGDFLISLMQKEDGSFYASYSHRDESFKDSYDKWSTQSGSYHAKIVIGLLKLYDATKDEKYKEASLRLCNFALGLQESNGQFISYYGTKDTHLHPHCYSAEGLLYAGLYLNNEDYLRNAAHATKWVLDIQMSNGGIPSMFVDNKFIGEERSDILAQALRLGIIMLHLNLIENRYKENLRKLAERLISFQYRNNDTKDDGGFFYGHDIIYGNLNAEKKNHLNSWCTMFALQALVYYRDYLNGDFNFNKDLFV